MGSRWQVLGKTSEGEAQRTEHAVICKYCGAKNSIVIEVEGYANLTASSTGLSFDVPTDQEFHSPPGGFMQCTVCDATVEGGPFETIATYETTQA